MAEPGKAPPDRASPTGQFNCRDRPFWLTSDTPHGRHERTALLVAEQIGWLNSFRGAPQVEVSRRSAILLKVNEEVTGQLA